MTALVTDHPERLLEHLRRLGSGTAIPWLSLPWFGAAPAFLRTLLVADGTVTDALAAFFLEPVGIEVVDQRPLPGQCLPVLASETTDALLYRQVRLVGERTGRLYCTAATVLSERHVDHMMFSALLERRIGIGAFLRNHARGSYREVVHMAQSGVLTPAAYSRSYRVFLDRQPGMVITEEFPAEPFENPPYK